jgi:NADH-quinone oxidoreductase subunit B
MLYALQEFILPLKIKGEGSTMDFASRSGHIGVVTTALDTTVNWARTGAMWPLLFGLACCAIEMMATQASNYDLSRFGMELNRASPRQADLMIVAGRVSRKMAPVIRQLYDQMASPKWVIAMGACAASGCNFNNYSVVQGVDEIIPVDVYIAGCPPRPEQLIHGILTLHEKIRGESPSSGTS